VDCSGQLYPSKQLTKKVPRILSGISGDVHLGTVNFLSSSILLWKIAVNKENVMFSVFLIVVILLGGAKIMSLVDRLHAVKAAHDAKVQEDQDIISGKDATIADLQAKLAAGGVLTPEEEAALEDLEKDLNIPTPPAGG
jgi:hypothetical protein